MEDRNEMKRLKFEVESYKNLSEREQNKISFLTVTSCMALVVAIKFIVDDSLLASSFGAATLGATVITIRRMAEAIAKKTQLDGIINELEKKLNNISRGSR